MTQKRCVRLLALGGLAVALGCRAHPSVPPCTTPLLPGEVVPGPAYLAPGPPVPGAPAPTPPPSVGAQLPKPIPAKPDIQPPKQFAKLPEATYPPTKPPLKSVATTPPAGVTDLPPVLPPADIAPLLTTNPKSTNPVTLPDALPARAPVSKPPLIEVPRTKGSDDGFIAGPRLPAGNAEPVVVVPPESPGPPLPLKPGERFGHGPDYAWVAGVADRHQKGGFWTIRYADIGMHDIWGGKVRLLDDDRLRDLRNGDVVYVEGELLAPKSAAASSMYPPYRATSVRVVEKAR